MEMGNNGNGQKYRTYDVLLNESSEEKKERAITSLQKIISI
jgi:hypothetical protein